MLKLASGELYESLSKNRGSQHYNQPSVEKARTPGDLLFRIASIRCCFLVNFWFLPPLNPWAERVVALGSLYAPREDSASEATYHAASWGRPLLGRHMNAHEATDQLLGKP